MNEDPKAAARLRLASDSDADSLAELRFEWDQPRATPTDDERPRFRRQFVRWWQHTPSRHLCAVAENDGQLVGAAWLVLYERVPNPSHFDRASGDIQSVYVRPAYRRAGIGRGLVRLLLAEGERRGLTGFTVDANDHALPLYESEGFVSNRFHLERVPARRRAAEYWAP